MIPDVKIQVEALAIVRSVVPYHPAYRLEEFMRDNLEQSAELFPLLRYNIQVFEPGPNQKGTVATRIQALGGTVDQADAGKFLLVATLTGEQLLQVITWDEVSFVDRWGPYEEDMNVAREISGADYVEAVGGFTGTGVRGEVFDIGFNVDHNDLQGRIILHTPVSDAGHGASTSGIVFGDAAGSGQAVNFLVRGLLPEGIAILADTGEVGLAGQSRYNHTRELVDADFCNLQGDPNCPYDAVFQTASVGTSPRTTEYTSISADMDSIIFDFDVLICQSQSNCGDPSVPFCDQTLGPTQSRPQAWAKNIVSVGGTKHLNTPARNDDTWCQGTSSCTPLHCASIGPTADGRIKPELVHFYDCIDTITCCAPDAYTPSFGGTSGATPITCGYFGLLFQMWHEGVFPGFGGGLSVFDSRPHATTARALMINTAFRYPLTQADITRDNQGWGMVDVQKLYDLRDKMYIIDETNPLSNLLSPSMDFGAVVAAGQSKLRVTLVYADPPGTVSSSRHAINDLSLKVTSPSGVVYWGNCGLREGNFSSSTCTGPNPPAPSDPLQKPILDTVENVFVSGPEPGVWNIRVNADEINQDSHVETTWVDADFALVVTGMSDLVGACCLPNGSCIDTTEASCAQQQGLLFRSDRTCATIETCPELE